MDGQHPVRRLTAADRLLATRPIADLLAVYWTQPDRVVGTILGLSGSDAWRLRQRLHEQGHTIPVASKGPRRTTPTTSGDSPPPRSWPCPACRFKSRGPERLADHVSGVHLVANGASAAGVGWRCPAPDCESRDSLHDAGGFLAHSHQHLFGRSRGDAPPSPAARKLRVSLTPPNLPEEPPAEDDGGPTRRPAWRCPACSFVSSTADGLAGHVRLVHVALTSEGTAATTWACPNLGCDSERIESAQDLALHLEAHAILQPAVAPRRRGRPMNPSRPCLISGCEATVIGRGFCRRHYDLDRKRRRSEGSGSGT